MKNNQKPKMHFCIILTIVSLISFILSIIYKIYPMILILLLISITSFVCIFIFKKRSKAFDRAINYFKVFKYSKQEWKQYKIKDLQLRFQEKKSIFIFLSIITIIIFTIFILITKVFVLFLVMLGLIIMYFILGIIIPKILIKTIKNKEGEILIFKKGVVIGKTFYTWDFPLSKLSSVRKINSPFEHYQIAYEFFDRLGPRSYVIRVPIPKENQKEFEKTIKQNFIESY